MDILLFWWLSKTYEEDVSCIYLYSATSSSEEKTAELFKTPNNISPYFLDVGISKPICCPFLLI